MTGDQRWTQLPDAGLVERVWHPIDRAEQQAALAEIFRRYREVVSTHCVRYLDDMDRVQDVVQETFKVATDELIRGGNLQEPEKLPAWLCGIARNRCRQDRRRRGKQGPLSVETLMADDDEQDRLRREEVVNQLLDIVAQSFTRHQRRIFQLSTRQLLHGKALAAALSVSAKQAHKFAYENKIRLEEGFGALILAKHGRPHCAGLARILDGARWDDVHFTRVLNRRIIRHLGTCKTCDNCVACIERLPRLKRRYAGALIPILIAPALTEQVLEMIRRAVDEEDERNRKNRSTAGVAAASTVPDQQAEKSGWDVFQNILGGLVLIGLVASVGSKVFPDLFNKGGSTSGTVALNIWTPPDRGSTTGRVQVHSQPAGMNCVMSTENDPCHASFKSGTQITLTATISPALTQSRRELVWLGCGNGLSAAQPCTLVLVRDTSVCVVPAGSSSWTIDICRQRAGG